MNNIYGILQSLIETIHCVMNMLILMLTHTTRSMACIDLQYVNMQQKQVALILLHVPY